MNNKNLIVYQLNPLYKIFKELEDNINFSVIEILDEKNLIDETKNLNNYLIITKKEISRFNNQFILSHLPIKIYKMIEKLNIEFLKKKFNQQSEINIGDYKINLNARELILNNNKIKLTEKESGIILYLSKAKKPISIDELQYNVWGYKLELETHTVETHIYRLRKKLLNVFKDNDFIISKKNGYQITPKKK